MALSSKFCVVNLSSYSRKHESLLVIKARSFKDEERSRNIVDANLRILGCRIEEARVKEKLEKCYHRGQQGWNYSLQTGYEKNHGSAQKKKIWFSVELAIMVGWTFGLTILCGTFGLCFVSIFVHVKI